ncbi:hypothetical protein WJX73_002030 [Symbiochloris irregularis]|uniref:Uncharacterized protein n=1 Tax=Symbiochloris irregularis TaxID=706552 RepID=A0AAW1PIP3_9CHLO
MATHTEATTHLNVALPTSVQRLADQPLQKGTPKKLDARQRAVILDALGQLKGVIDRLLLLLARNTLPEVPDFCKDQASPEFVQQVITYAHKLCFTTFAPPGYSQQTPLRHFRPPAPQEWQMHSSLLHAFARKEEARQAAAERGLSAAQQAEAAQEAVAQEAGSQAAPTWAANQPVPQEDMQDVQHAPEWSAYGVNCRPVRRAAPNAPAKVANIHSTGPARPKVANSHSTGPARR